MVMLMMKPSRRMIFPHKADTNLNVSLFEPLWGSNARLLARFESEKAIEEMKERNHVLPCVCVLQKTAG